MEEDLGRLNVSDLTIEAELGIGQQIFETGAFKGSEGSLQRLQAYNINFEFEPWPT